MSYTFKGTPGKWISHYDDGGFYYIDTKTGNYPSPYISATGGEYDIDKANSLLESKAPEMFVMLKRAKQCFEALNEKGVMAIEIEQLLKEATEL